MAACDSCTQQFPSLTERILLQRKGLALTPVNSVYLNHCCLQSYSSNHSTLSRIGIMGAKTKKNRNPGFTIHIPPHPKDMTVKQYLAAGKALQRSFDDDAGAPEQKWMDKLKQFYKAWVPDLERRMLNIYIFPREVLTSEPSILYDQVPSRLYHHGPKHSISKVPVKLLSTIFHQLPLFDRVNLARCSKRLAQIAIENKILELGFKDRDRLSDRKGFFADPSNFPLLWSLGTPGCCIAIHGTWWVQARAEIERQDGVYTPGIHEAISRWFISEMDPEDERIEWWGY